MIVFIFIRLSGLTFPDCYLLNASSSSRSVIQDEMTPRRQHTLTHLFLQRFPFFRRTAVIFLLAHAHLVATGHDTDAPYLGVHALLNISDRISYLHHLIYGRESPNRSYSYRSYTERATGRDLVRCHQIIYPISFGLGSGTDNLHHLRRVPGRRADLYTLLAKHRHRLQDSRYRSGEILQGSEQMFLETSVHLIHVPLVPVPLIQGTELLVHLRILKIALI